MKRVLIVATIACVLLGAGIADAKELKFKGQFDQHVSWLSGTGFQDSGDAENSEDDFNAKQRVRMYFEYVDSEDLRGVVGFEINSTWGSPAGGGALGTDATNVQVKHAYTDFTVAGVDVRVGLQPLAMPSYALGTALLSDDVAGIVAGYKFSDLLSLSVAWARLYDDDDTTPNITGHKNNVQDEADLFTVMAPVTADGWAVTPFVAYAAIGADVVRNAGDTGTLNQMSGLNARGYNGGGSTTTYTMNSGENFKALWTGAAFKLDLFDPLVFAADFTYGTVRGGDPTADEYEDEMYDRSGWFMSAKLDYKLDMCTPELLFFYGSGNDGDVRNGSEEMPNFTGGDNAGFSVLSGGDLAFAGGHWGTNEANLTGAGDYGLWGVGLAIKDFSFVQNLKHSFAVVYGKGTNDPGSVADYKKSAGDYYLTDEDSYLDFVLTADYALYENLTLWGAASYLKVDFDEEAWTYGGTNYAEETSAMTRLIAGIRYEF